LSAKWTNSGSKLQAYDPANKNVRLAGLVADETGNLVINGNMQQSTEWHE